MFVYIVNFLAWVEFYFSQTDNFSISNHNVHTENECINKKFLGIICGFVRMEPCGTKIMYPQLQCYFVVFSFTVNRSFCNYVLVEQLMHNPVLLVFVKLLITGTSNVDDNVIKQFEYGTLGDGYGMGVMVPAACLVIFGGMAVLLHTDIQFLYF